MPLRRSKAIVLRSYRVGEADKIVVFFTLDLGKIRGIAKGSRRPRSRFGGSLEIGNEVELTLFEKESRELVSVDRCDIVRSGFRQFGDPILATTLGYVTDLADAFAPEREPNHRIYRLLRAMIASLSSPTTAETRARYFEAWILRLSGLHPFRRTCVACGKPLLEQGGARFSLSERRLVCRSCGDGLSEALSISSESLQFLEEVWARPPEEVAPPRPGVLRELGGFHYRLVQEHVEKELKSHQVLEDMLREGRIR
jgi:DNA repair protein RecO (recombination protein O)